MVEGSQGNVSTGLLLRSDLYGLCLAPFNSFERSNTVENEPFSCDNTLPPMMKLAICCAAKGVGTSNTNDRPKETSCEGSSTEGGC
ncbi:unnamed protein product [Brassica oleracea var. botrytis]|uniref:(rape) hypothetical protein n=1 Tax=Brassica napus TaxID=3708 RepID=A0A816KN21_BRANA|nr:unnamed protein product [Brassica napus]